MSMLVHRFCRLLIATLFVVGVGAVGGFSPVLAAERNDSAAVTAALSEQAVGAHQSLIKIKDLDGGPVHKNLKIGIGKSVLLEFPRDVRDVMVSNPQAIDAVVLSANRVFLLARKFGEANAFFFDAQGEQIATMELFVDRETAGVESLLNRILVGSRIKVENFSGTMVLTGSVKTPADSVRAGNIAKQFASVTYKPTGDDKAEGTTIESVSAKDGDPVINMLAVEAEEQVMLQVKVAEVQRSVLKQFGVNLGSVITAGNFSTTVLTDNTLPITSAAGLGALPQVGVGVAAAAATAGCAVGALCTNSLGTGGIFRNSGVTSGWQSGGSAVNGAIRALERNGLIRTLAEPNLTAVSGEPAKFLAGGEYPVPNVDSLGGLSVTFKEFGVGLAFTPIVLSEGRISLKIETEVSELTNDGAITLNGISIPALKKRQAKSTVELPSGGTLAFAGLISEDVRQNIDGFPGLKDVPVLGTLFRSRDFQKSETELVVMVTPYLVKPVSAQQIALPGDGLAPATDLRADFLGELNRVYGQGTDRPDGGLKGDYGFIVE